MRIVLGIEYNGTRYHGWAEQNGLATIQGCLQQALSSIADHRVQLYCAGRTDTAVHATYQVAHFDTTATRNIQAWIRGTNALLADDIRVHWAKDIGHEFHARFSAIQRRYHYLIYNHPVASAIFSKQVTWIHHSLNYHDMADAAQFLVGEHDFSSFRSSECQSKSTMRNITQIDIFKKGHLICIDISANAFLHHMVRNIVGSLLIIGRGQQKVSWLKNVLQAGDRRHAGPTALPHGLYLTQVLYPKQFNLSEKAIIPMSMII